MLVIRCAACRNKLLQYEKIGKGEVFRCHKDRIKEKLGIRQTGNTYQCPCGKDIGIDKGTFIKMIDKTFTYSGTKRNS